MFTHWACFDCRKSFAKEPLSEGARKCSECAEPMTDMGAYFEPPRKLSVKRWAVMKVLTDYGYKFNTKDSQIYIQNQILQAKNPRVADVIERIELEKQRGQKKSYNENFKSGAENIRHNFTRVLCRVCRTGTNYGDSRG